MKFRCFFLVTVLIIFTSLCSFADDCYDAFTEAKYYYNNSDYKTAKELFEYVKSECGEDYTYVSNWIEKCNAALYPRLSVSKSEISASASGVTEYITVTGNVAWEIEYPSATMYNVTRNGDRLTVVIYKNSSTDSRTDYFNVKTVDGTKVLKISLSQSGYTSGTEFSYTHSDGDTYKVKGTTRTYTDNAEALSYLTENIKKWEECRTGAITENGLGVAIYANSGYAYTGGISNDLAEKIKYANDNSMKIHDICISENGNYWCIVYGDGGWKTWAPTAFNDKLREADSDNDKITSVSINENGEWVIITDKHLYSSNTTLQNKLSEISSLYGYIYSVTLTNKGYVICAERGVYCHNVPTNVFEKIKTFAKSRVVKVLKFTDSGTYLITDGESYYSYHM